MRPRSTGRWTAAKKFQSTHPLRGATRILAGRERRACCISIHAPLAGCDCRLHAPARRDRNFNPRTPCGVRRARAPDRGRGGRISIHAPLAGCDFSHKKSPFTAHISIHAPLAGCDAPKEIIKRYTKYFNPRTPCGVRPSTARGSTAWTMYFNPRTLAGCDISRAGNWCTISTFQSTHPLRGATIYPFSRPRLRKHFNPRTPCGVRRALAHENCNRSRFQSTHPLRGATFCPRPACYNGRISIHAPLAGCDRPAPTSTPTRDAFQSTHPLRGATRPGAGHIVLENNFNPRTPCGVRLMALPRPQLQPAKHIQ